MEEIQSVKEESNPHESLLVVDGLTGQDAVNVAEEFNSSLNILDTSSDEIDLLYNIKIKYINIKNFEFNELNNNFPNLKTIDYESILFCRYLHPNHLHLKCISFPIRPIQSSYICLDWKNVLVNT